MEPAGRQAKRNAGTASSMRNELVPEGRLSVERPAASMPAPLVLWFPFLSASLCLSAVPARRAILCFAPVSSQCPCAHAFGLLLLLACFSLSCLICVYLCSSVVPKVFAFSLDSLKLPLLCYASIFHTQCPGWA